MFFGPHTTEAKRKISKSLEGNKRAFGSKGQQGKIGLSNANNPAWKGDKAGCVAKHNWIKRHYGKANVCDLDNNHKANVFHWHNLSKLYKRERSDWIRVCPRCHKILEEETGMKRSDEFKQKVSLGLKKAYAEGRRKRKI